MNSNVRINVPGRHVSQHHVLLDGSGPRPHLFICQQRHGRNGVRPVTVLTGTLQDRRYVFGERHILRHGCSDGLCENSESNQQEPCFDRAFYGHLPNREFPQNISVSFKHTERREETFCEFCAFLWLFLLASLTRLSVWAIVHPQTDDNASNSRRDREKRNQSQETFLSEPVGAGSCRGSHRDCTGLCTAQNSGSHAAAG